jgi:hypothetical protein
MINVCIDPDTHELCVIWPRYSWDVCVIWPRYLWVVCHLTQIPMGCIVSWAAKGSNYKWFSYTVKSFCHSTDGMAFVPDTRVVERQKGLTTSHCRIRLYPCAFQLGVYSFTQILNGQFLSHLLVVSAPWCDESTVRSISPLMVAWDKTAAPALLFPWAATKRRIRHLGWDTGWDTTKAKQSNCILKGLVVRSFCLQWMTYLYAVVSRFFYKLWYNDILPISILFNILLITRWSEYSGVHGRMVEC